MSQYTLPTKETASPESRIIFENIEKGLGRLPNLYAYIGHSSNALASYLAFQQSQAKGSFTAKQREAVFLAVSQVNQCQYCLGVHTTIGKMNGFSEEETKQLRAGTHPDAKLRAITQLAGEIQRNHGRPSQAALDAFFAQGYGEAALVDLVSLVTDKIFANYLHNISQVEIDFPLAQPLEEVAA